MNRRHKGDHTTATLSVVFFLCTLLSLTAYAEEKKEGFDTRLTQSDVRFHITCPNSGSLNNLTIIPEGLSLDNSTITTEIDGIVTGAEIDDLNGDGFPEIYIYVNSAGSGSYGSLVAYSSNQNKSISPIYLPPLENDKLNAKGYMGHDQFAILNGELTRSFPVYKENDSNARPTGGTRQLSYKLVPGEATWTLQITNSTTF